MITCPTCQKENQDHYKFCLGCGSKLEAASAAAPVPVAPQSPSPAPSMGSASPTVPGDAPPTGGIPCPNCALQNPAGFAFCGRCGTKLDAAVAVHTHAGPAPSSPAAAAPAGAPRPVPDMGSARTVFVDAATPAPPPSATPAPAPAAPAVRHAARLIMLGNDGEPVGERLLQGENLEVGRDCGAPWDDDAYLSPRHAALSPTSEGVKVDDFGSVNGVFFKLEGKTELRDQDMFRVGQELIQYEDLPEPEPAADGSERMGSPNPGYWARLKTMVEPQRPCSAWPIEAESFAIGREHGDVTFPQDGYVSGSHCRIFGDDSGVYLEDLGSSNGTYVRVRNGDVVPFGRTLLIGQRLFRIEAP